MSITAAPTSTLLSALSGAPAAACSITCRLRPLIVHALAEPADEAAHDRRDEGADHGVDVERRIA
jgi:hypothetical protein